MTRQEIENRLLDYVVNEVSDAERVQIARAVELDATLREKLDELRETVGMVAAAGGAEARLSAGRREAVLRAASGEATAKAVSASGSAAVGTARRAGPGGNDHPGRPEAIVREAAPTSGDTPRRRLPVFQLGAAAALLLACGLFLLPTLSSARLRSQDAGGARFPELTSGVFDSGEDTLAARAERHVADSKKNLKELGPYPNTYVSRYGTDAEYDALDAASKDIRGAVDTNSPININATSLDDLRKLQHGDPAHQPAAKPYTPPASDPSATLGVASGTGSSAAGGDQRVGLLVVQDAHGRWGQLPGDKESRTEEYSHIADNPFLRVTDQPLSTFSIDVDTAAYANVRRYLTQGSLPPADAVRIEELVNYFRYDYRKPSADDPFAVNLEVHAAPWQPKHRLVRIGLRGREIAHEQRPVSNLVFLIDVSGSMNEPAKLPLVKQSLRMLVDQLGEPDHVAMVVYAGSSGLVLPSTSGVKKDQILAALDKLQAGGSTNGGQGIQLAYRVAEENFIKGGTNRVILCTDGDFNVGVTSEGELVRLIEDKRKSGVFLSVLGFGRDNYADARMQQLADKGNGNASYIDTVAEARKVLVEEMSGTLITIAKDVKIQVEFNPSKVSAYRLVGYENRMLAAQDFNDDAKDAGEIGAGHQVTALYEIVTTGQDVPGAMIDPLKYQQEAPAGAAASDDLLTVKLRYKDPEGSESAKIEVALTDPGSDAEVASADYDFAASVAAFGMLLRNSEHKGQASWDLAIELALEGLEFDPNGYRRECVELMRKAKALSQH